MIKTNKMHIAIHIRLIRAFATSISQSTEFERLFGYEMILGGCLVLPRMTTMARGGATTNATVFGIESHIKLNKLLKLLFALS